MKKIKIFISWVAVILWMMLIFSFSAQNGEDSGALSDTIIFTLVIPFLELFGIYVSDINIIALLTRKAAHMFVYFILAILFINAILVSNLFTKIKYSYTTALILTFLYACVDEFHQSFSPGRHMSFIDVLIDTLGASIGLLLFYYISVFIKKIYAKKIDNVK